MPSKWKATKHTGVYVSKTAARCVYMSREYRDGKEVSVQRAESFPLKDKFRLTASDGSSRLVDAITYAKARKAQHDTERTAGRVHNPEDEDMTVGDYFERWYARPSSFTGEARRTGTLKRIETSWRLHIAPAFADVPVRSVTRSMVLDWHAKLTCGPGSRNKAVRTLSSIMNSAVQEELRPNNPCRGLKANDGVKAVSREQVLTEDQFAALKAAFDPRYALMLELLAAGMRLGEVIGLRRDRVNLKGDVRIDSQVTEVNGVRVEGPPKSKNGNRTLPLAHLAVELQQHIGRYSEQAPDGFVFTSLEGHAPLWASSWRHRAFDPAVRASGVPPLTPHALRHVAVCRLLDAGFSLFQVARWVGDTAGTVEKTYANLLPNSADRMAQVFARVAEGVQ